MKKTTIRQTLPIVSVFLGVWVILSAAAFLVLFALPCAAGELAIAAPAAHYNSTVSNRVQSLTFSLPGEGMQTQSPEGPEILYTTNGDDPRPGGKSTHRYNGDIRIDRSMTVRYCSFADGQRSEVKELRFVYLAPVRIRKLVCKKGKPCRIAIQWKGSRDAEGYRVYRKKKGASEWKRIASLRGADQTGYTDSGVTANAEYSYYVASCKGKVESLKGNCAQSVKAKHTHCFRVKSVDCGSGVRTLKCEDCGETKQEHRKKGHQLETVRDGCYTVERCKNCGKTVKKYLSKRIPEYWNEPVANALDKAKGHGDLPGYVFVTDPHWSMNAGNSPAIVSFLTRQMNYPFAVCGGDVIAKYQDSKKAAQAEIDGFYSRFTVPVLSVAGNHDYNDNCSDNEDAWFSQQDVERLIYAHNPRGTRMTHGGDFGCLDDTAHKIRYITFYYDETAALSPEVLSDIDERVCELDENWSVVLFSHAYWHYKRLGSEPTVKDESRRIASALLDIQSRSRATIALWHVGHIHRDRQKLLSDRSGTTLLVVSTNCDTYDKSADWGGLEMEKGTKTEQVADIVQIDQGERRVYMTRVGAGSSRNFSY